MREHLPLVIGASGFIGNILWRRLIPDGCLGTFCNHFSPDLFHLDICETQKTLSFLRRLSPSVIFLPAALPYADACESDPEKSWAINVKGVSNIIRAARELRTKLVFFSSDYVFSGECGPYSEADEPCPINIYGEAKLAMERLIQEQLEDHLIVRINGVYGWERARKNFVIGVIDRLSAGQTMRVPIDQVGCPTYADNMVEVVCDLCKANERGLFHVAGSRAIDRYTFAGMVAAIWRLEGRLLVPARTADLGQKAARPLKAGLRIDKVQQHVHTKLIGPGQGLRLMKKQGDPFITRYTAVD